ncbi:MAG: hypothetical protein WCV50_03735 [Patescibacteria group bacterium]|jgi:hypothetical protein
MSTREKNKNSSKNTVAKQTKFSLLASLLVLSLLIVIGVTGYFYGRHDSNKTNSPIPTIDVSQNQQQKVLGAEIRSWHGKIVAIDGLRISLATKDIGTNSAIQDTTIIAIIKTSTEIEKWDLTKPDNIDTPGQNKTTLKADELRPGQEAIVRSTKDPNEKNEVSASSIQILVTPSTK